MADKKSSIRKKPVSQKRVAMVLASLVGSMTISAGVLLLMEGGAMGTSSPPGAFVADPNSLPAQLLPQVPLQAARWDYIIVYESGDASVSAESLSDGPFAGGIPKSSVRPKANFHFVIDSSFSGPGTTDGKLEVSTNWISQDAIAKGAPPAAWPDSRSYSYNYYGNAVGICVAADMHHPISERQYQTLLESVQNLQRLLNIPKDRVLFHWDPSIPGARQASHSQSEFDRQFHAELQ